MLLHFLINLIDKYNIKDYLENFLLKNNDFKNVISISKA